MKKGLFLLFFCVLYFPAFGQDSQPMDIAIIPEPVKIIKMTGWFTLPKKVIIESPKKKSLNHALAFLANHLSTPTGSQIKVVSHSVPNAAIRLKLNTTADTTLGDEGYRLSVSPQNITIKANKSAGLFYGIQSLIQLFPPQ